MRVALLFEWDDLVGVYRSRELARRHAGGTACTDEVNKSLAQREKRGVHWETDSEGNQRGYTNKGVQRFEIAVEEVLEV